MSSIQLICIANDCNERLPKALLCRKHKRRFDLYGDCNYPSQLKGRSTHGLSKLPEYKVWTGMKMRCNNPKTNGFHNYGGRGIKVCNRWMNSFPDFYDDMGPRPSKNHSIDRINNDGNYEPNNCRWTTKDQQGLNRRPLRLSSSGVRGVYPNIGRNGKFNSWQVNATINHKTTYIGCYKTIEQASEAYEKFRQSRIDRLTGKVAEE